MIVIEILQDFEKQGISVPWELLVLAMFMEPKVFICSVAGALVSLYHWGNLSITNHMFSRVQGAIIIKNFNRKFKQFLFIRLFACQKKVASTQGFQVESL